MAKQVFKVDIDLEQNELLQARVENVGTAPASPEVGQIYYDTTVEKMGIYTQSNDWMYFVAGSSGGSGYLTNINAPQTAITVTVSGTVATLSIADATTTNSGFMSTGDKTKLDNATSANTASTLVERDASGVINVSQITISGAPTNPTDAATKGYVDGLVQGLKTKLPARAISTTDITLSGPQTIDDVSLIADDRVLVAGQDTASENGIYIVQAGAWTRADDLPTGSAAANIYLFIEEGDVNADTGWVCTNNTGSDVVGTAGLTFVKFSSAGAIEAGAGLTKTGNMLNVGANTDNSITVNPNDIQVKRDPNGGIGVNANGIEVNADDGITVSGAGVKVNPNTAKGIDVTASGVEIIANTNGGINIDPTDGVEVKRDPDGGIGVNANGIEVNPKTNGGIEVDSTGVSVKGDNARAVTVGPDGVGVNVDGTNVAIVGNQITLGSGATKTYYKDVTLAAGVATTINHNLNTTNYNITIIDQSTGEHYMMNVEHDLNSVDVTSNSAESVRVIITGNVGVAIP